MKFFFIYFLLISSVFHAQKTLSNPIDQIQSKEEAQKFIQTVKINGKDFSKTKLLPIREFNDRAVSERIKKLADSLQIKDSYYKGDLDGNGLTDLLFTADDGSCMGSKKNSDGKYEDESCSFGAFALMDFGKSFAVFEIYRNVFNACTVQIVKKDGKNFVELNYDEINEDISENLKYTHLYRQKLLTFKFGSFVEYNSNPSHHTITEINYETSGCFGTCPVFTLVLKPSVEKSVFVPKYYNFSEESHKQERGIFYANIKQKDFEEITYLLNYLNFTNLNDEYNVLWTDDQTGDLIIKYDNGTTKHITDYGLQGTEGLRLVHSKLMRLRFSQEWKKTKNR